MSKGVTDEQLLKQARQAIHGGKQGKRKKLWLYGPVWACFGAAVTGLVWLGTMLL